MSEISSIPPVTSSEEAASVAEQGSATAAMHETTNPPIESERASSQFLARSIKVARVCQRGSIPTILNGKIYPPTAYDRLQVKVLAVGISKQVRNRVLADNSVTSEVDLPFDPSVDGVVEDESTGDIYYVLPRITPRGHSLLSERVNIAKDLLFKLPRNFNPVKIAGLSAAWLISWSLLLCCHKRQVLIIGATTCQGRAAAHVAQWLGASVIIGLSDDEAALMTVTQLNQRAVLSNPVQVPNFKGIEIVIDFIGGNTAIEVLKQINNGTNSKIQYMPAWGQRNSQSLVMNPHLIIYKGIKIIDPSLAMWRLTDRQMREKLRFGIWLMAMLQQVPFEIVARPMSEVGTAWDEDDFKNSKKMLVLVP